ncbi:MAG TPA: hypothetical protein VMY42_20625 [Thermoguttaceae bacterium]|nr:hypothetical protein [Thermoguttaceae bacterium]
MQLRIRFEGGDEVRADLAASERRAEDLGVPLRLLGLHHQRKAQRILRSGERGIRSRNPSSGLEGSITFTLPALNELEVGSNKAYAASQQFGPPGGVYRPVKGQFLTIPIADNVGARGNPKYDSPREVPDGFFFRSKRGGLFFGRDLGKTKKGKGRRRKKIKGQALGDVMFGDVMETMELLFVLVREVVGTDYMYVTHDDEDQTVWDQLAVNWVLYGKR